MAKIKTQYNVRHQKIKLKIWGQNKISLNIECTTCIFVVVENNATYNFNLDEF